MPLAAQVQRLASCTCDGNGSDKAEMKTVKDTALELSLGYTLCRAYAYGLGIAPAYGYPLSNIAWHVPALSSPTDEGYLAVGTDGIVWEMEGRG